MTGRIPLVDLKAQYAAHRAELDGAVAACIGATSFVGGPDHKAFSQEFADFCGGGHAALCASGTDALYLAILGLLGPGDGTGEIVTTAHTFIATAEAVLMAGYRPVFADVDPQTMVLDPDCAARAVGPRTRAILPVHLYGQMAPMDRIMALAEAHGLAVIEDAAQAHGASWMDRGPGVWGHAACFSFYPGKNLGAWGDGGAVFTRDEGLARDLRMRLDHGRTSKYLHEREGENSRLDGLQAAVLRVKLRHLAAWNARRRDLAALYDDLLAGTPGLVLPTVRREAGHVFHLYAVRVPQRDRVLAALSERGIGAGAHYPVPLHRQPVYAGRGYEAGPLPHTEAAAAQVLSLPLFPELTEAQARTVAGALREILAGL